MDERELADRFNRDVDDLLNQSGRTDSVPAPNEYRQALDLARALAGADFSDESRMRQAVRRRLLDQARAREVESARKEHSMSTLLRRHPIVGLAAAVVVVVLAATLIWPGALSAAAQVVGNVVRSLTIGPNTQVQQINPASVPTTPRPRPAKPEVSYSGDMWVIRTPIGNFGGNALPGGDRSVRRYGNLADAQADAAFVVRQPETLPAGYVLREVMVTPADWVFLFYDGPDGDLVLGQIPVGERSRSEAGNVGSVTSVMVGTLTDQPIESVTLNGRPATWVEGLGLMWEADGVSYVLGGAGLKLDEATRIAESLR